LPIRGECKPSCALAGAAQSGSLETQTKKKYVAAQLPLTDGY